MTDTALAPAASPDAQDPNYREATIDVGGSPMTFRFYLGFASRVTYTPKGGAEILVYQQESVFNIPKDPSGKQELLSSSTLRIKGGPDALDVELEIDDAPIVDYQGPIGEIAVKTKKHAKDPKIDKRVKVTKGGGQVQSVDVTLNADMGKGGVFAFQEDDGGVTKVVNQAATCPPHC